MLRRRFISFILIVLLLSLALVPPSAAQDDDDIVVRVGLHAAEKNLNPFIVPQGLPLTHDFTMLVYDSLFWSQSRLDPEPWLATGAEPSEDYRTWTVTLRDDVFWHDGVRFTADDVAFTFRYFADDGGPGRYGHHVYDHPVFVSASVVDDTTVEITFEDPVPTFRLLPGGDLPILPKHVWEGIENPRADATSLPVGTGPYRMVEYNPGVSYRLEANPDYFKGAPTVDTLIMPVITDAQAAFAGLQTGELDFVTRNLPAPLVSRVEEHPELSVITGSRMQSAYLMFNTRKPHLRNPVVRKAMSMALDVQAIVDIVEGGLGRPGNDTWTHPDSAWAHPEGGHEFNVDAARSMLDEAGYVAGDDGIRRNADGAELAFTLLVNATAPPQIRSGELVAEQLGAIGVDITVEPLDPPAIAAARRPSPDGPPTVDMFIAVFESHAHADPDHLFFFFHSPGRGVGAIFSGFASPDFDAILDSALGKPISEKLALIARAQDIFADEAPAVVLYYPDGRWGYRPSAYDGWASDPGHGVFTKRSFLTPSAADSNVSETAGETAAEDIAEAAEERSADADAALEAAAPSEDATEAAADGTDIADDAADEGTPDEPAADDAAQVDDEGGAGGAVAIVVILLLVAVVAAFAVAQRRRRTGTVED